MTRSWWAKCLVLVFFTLLSVVYVWPTIANLNLETTKFPFKQKINLGLDLQGGLYMVLGIDFDKVYHDVVERQGSSMQARLKDKGINVSSMKMNTAGLAADDPHFVVDFDPAKHDEVYALAKKEFWTLRLVNEKPGEMEFGMGHDFHADVRDRTVNQSIEVIRNRIDEFGVSEPVISSQGEDRVVVELPGVREIDRAKDLIGRTAKLEFKIVDDQTQVPGGIGALVAKLEKDNNVAYKAGDKFSEYVKKINELAKGKIPDDDEISFEHATGRGRQQTDATMRIPYLLHAKTELSGEDLQDASVELDPETRRPEVGFSMNPRGAAIFGNVTEANKGHRLAIVLDSLVQSAPVIQSKITDRGRITLGQNESEDDMMKEAKDLAIVLRAGALPAQLEFQEQRVVGPSLGQDSIKKGAMASIVGILAVFLFIGIYYRVSGMIAVLSLLLNVLFVLAILVGLDATLTLPGIAGIALTVGIAVDSNVVIYERIREELHHGKRPHGAVEAGFQKAFRTIMDANVTNAAAGVILLMYGTGPIKGFAVTLLIGIVTTLFTAVFVCRLIFDIYLSHLEQRNAETISI